MYYLVTECLKGGELFNRIVHKSFYSENDARGVIYILMQTIAYLHHHRIVHRDLKPENLLLYAEDDTSIKIADFGFAERTDGFISLKTQCGTPGYVAPEILLDQPYGKAVDMWAIGVIMYVLLGGYPPFRHDDTPSIVTEDVEFHAEYWDQVSEDAKDLIQKLLRKDPLERWSAEEALKHPWMTHDAADLSLNLGTNLQMYQKSHKLRKFKGAVKAVIATQRIRRVLDSFAAAKNTLDKEEAETEAKLLFEKAEKEAQDDVSLREAVKAAKEEKEAAGRTQRQEETPMKPVKRASSKSDEHMALMKEKLDTELVKDIHVVEAVSFFDIYELGEVVSTLLDSQS
jgi:hypothetical protein